MTRSLMLMASMLVSLGTMAANETSTDVGQTRVVTQRHAITVAEPWKAWGLTATDWKRYQSIMAGPRGVWSPNVSPLTALGVHAESEVDRLRYAKISAELDYRRIRAEAHWQLTFDSVKDRVWAELGAKAPSAPTLETLKSHQRVSLFTSVNCDARCRRVMDSLKKTQTNVDVYFVGTASNSEIVDWAKQQNLPPEAVNQTRQYSLNHDNGILESLGKSADDLPLVLIKSDAGLYEVVAL